MARPQKCRCICSIPGTTGFLPEGSTPNGTVTIGYDEYEVIRLLDYVQLTQAECAKKMARQIMADAMVNGRSIRIEGGDVIVCRAMKPECVNELHCCHRK